MWVLILVMCAVHNPNTLAQCEAQPTKVYKTERACVNAGNKTAKNNVIIGYMCEQESK
jgi:hypothetical protein